MGNRAQHEKLQEQIVSLNESSEEEAKYDFYPFQIQQERKSVGRIEGYRKVRARIKRKKPLYNPGAYLNKGYDSVPSQPADPANFSLMDLINSLADPGPEWTEKSG